MAVKSETRDVHDFDEVLLRGTGEIYLKQGDAEALTVEADEYLLGRIKTEVTGRRLVLELRSWMDYLSLIGASPIRFHLSMKNVKSVSISGSGNLLAPSIHSDELKLQISGSGKVEVPLITAGSVSFSISGAGKAELGGEVQSQDLHISGSGNYQASDLESQHASIRISGSGHVELAASNTLKVSISGSGDVKYRGNPQVSQSISGSGRVEQVGGRERE